MKLCTDRRGTYVKTEYYGTHRVMITFDKRLREFDAMAHDQEGIKTGERVRVVNVKDNVLLVERIVRN